MKISSWGVWVFYKTKEEAESDAKRLNQLGSGIGVFVPDKIRVFKDNSLKFFVGNRIIAKDCNIYGWYSFLISPDKKLHIRSYGNIEEKEVKIKLKELRKALGVNDEN